MATAVQALHGTYDLDKTHSTVQFAVRHLGVSTFRASFNDIDARLTIEDDAVGLEARAVVESVSIDDPPDFREHVVRGFDFFAADDHPLITFTSTSVAFGEQGRAIVAGELSMRGASHAVTAHGTFFPPTEDPFGGQRVGLALAAAIDRKNWGMDWQASLPGGGEALGWQVEISAQLELIRTP